MKKYLQVTSFEEVYKYLCLFEIKDDEKLLINTFNNKETFAQNKKDLQNYIEKNYGKVKQISKSCSVTGFDIITYEVNKEK